MQCPCCMHHHAASQLSMFLTRGIVSCLIFFLALPASLALCLEAMVNIQRWEGGDEKKKKLSDAHWATVVWYASMYTDPRKSLTCFQCITFPYTSPPTVLRQWSCLMHIGEVSGLPAMMFLNGNSHHQWQWIPLPSILIEMGAFLLEMKT